MKIRAIRVAEIGQFSEPVAIEGFSGALDVLTGPNEIGKSTLFTALSTLLTEKYTSTARSLTALRPDAGGTPLIEADIELDGRLLRLRKRYLAQRSADLTDFGNGKIFRGTDAETEIERLFGGDQMRALRGLVWVAQGESFDLPAKSNPSLTASLAELIEREAADTAGTGIARRLANEVRTRLVELVTPSTGKPKAGSEFFKAHRQRDALAEALTTAVEKSSAAETRRRRLDEYRLEQRTTANPVLAQTLSARAAQTTASVTDAERARERLRAADERLTARQLTHDRARQDLEREQRLAAEIARLELEIAEALAGMERDEASKADLTLQLDEARAAGEHVSGELETARRRIGAAQAGALRQSRLLALADADQRLAAANDAHQQLTAAAERLAGNAVTETAVEQLVALHSRLSNLEARISAQAPRAAIAYLPASRQRIRIDDREIADGDAFQIERRTEIVIDGVGTLTIEPGEGDIHALQAERETCSTDLAARLSSLQLDSLAAAQSALVERRSDEASCASARNQLSALAPQGILALERSRASLAASLTQIGPDDAPDEGGDFESRSAETSDIATLERHVRALESELGAIAKRHDTLQNALRAVTTRMSVVEERTAAHHRRMGEIDAERPPMAERDARAALREAECQNTAAQLAEAVRERSAWAQAVPDSATFETLVAEAADAANAVTIFAQRRQILEREIAELEGAMNRDGEEGIATEVARLEDALAAAEARVADFDLDARALQLLADRLDRIGTEHRSTVLRPLVDRLQPLLDHLFSGARVSLDGPLLVARLERNERIDHMGRLSGGTREQIAILVRIAHAGLLAARGTPLPLVLDDALVYSDDERLAIMIETLAAASHRHQVVLLSCHERALDPLIDAHGACRLTLTPWREGATANSGSHTTKKSRAASPASDLAS